MCFWWSKDSWNMFFTIGSQSAERRAKPIVTNSYVCFVWHWLHAFTLVCWSVYHYDLILWLSPFFCACPLTLSAGWLCLFHGLAGQMILLRSSSWFIKLFAPQLFYHNSHPSPHGCFLSSTYLDSLYVDRAASITCWGSVSSSRAPALTAVISDCSCRRNGAFLYSNT